MKIYPGIHTHRGQPLAIYHAAEPGKPGHLVDGTEIPASSGKDIPVLKGVQRAVWGAGWQIWQAWGDWLVGKFHRFIYIA